MDPFVDSAGIAADGEAIAQRLREDGYLCVKGLLPREDVLRVREKFVEAAAGAGWLKPDTAKGEAIAEPAKACVDPEAPFVAVLKRFYRGEAGHALKLHPNVIGLFERLFGEPVLAHPLLIPRCIFPQRPEFTTPSHQDFPHIQGTTETMSLWLPLGDCPAEMGGLAIARGSHQDGVRDFTVSNGAGAMEVIDPLEGSWVAGPLEAGDVLIFHSLTVHKGLPNLTDRLRISLDNRYQRASEPICERCLVPYAGCGTWDEIYASWQSKDLPYYWRRQVPRITDFDMQYYEKRDRIAFDLAERGDRTARATLLRIVQRDPSPQKRVRASALLAKLDPQAAQPALP
ncbi:MAG TPA: phytanoyl-CoA dioxygenase family protein [Geminicoccaceae bacterium]|nr:phytanoyl-CoA dioxygenase family protein [Geminicoccaceae bacterium]